MKVVSTIQSISCDAESQPERESLEWYPPDSSGNWRLVSVFLVSSKEEKERNEYADGYLEPKYIYYYTTTYRLFWQKENS